MNFQAYLESICVEANSICILWLGQAGFLFKTAQNKIIVIDPYLTDYVYHLLKEAYGYGFKRMTATVFQPGDIEIDYLFSSHEHGDHLDLDAIVKLTDNERTLFFTNKEGMKRSVDAGVPLHKMRCLSKDMTMDFDAFKLIVLPADHGELCADALGFIFDFGFVRIYYSGDTAYNREILKKALEFHPEIALLPINGAFGNLNAEEAARLAGELKCKVCIPHHFWTFPMHKGEKGDPIDAVEYFPQYAPECRLVMLTPGEAFHF